MSFVHSRCVIARFCCWQLVVPSTHLVIQRMIISSGLDFKIPYRSGESPLPVVCVIAIINRKLDQPRLLPNKETRRVVFAQKSRRYDTQNCLYPSSRCVIRIMGAKYTESDTLHFVRARFVHARVTFPARFVVFRFVVKSRERKRGFFSLSIFSVVSFTILNVTFQNTEFVNYVYNNDCSYFKSSSNII